MAANENETRFVTANIFRDVSRQHGRCSDEIESDRSLQSVMLGGEGQRTSPNHYSRMCAMIQISPLVFSIYYDHRDDEQRRSVSTITDRLRTSESTSSISEASESTGQFEKKQRTVLFVLRST